MRFRKHFTEPAQGVTYFVVFLLLFFSLFDFGQLALQGLLLGDDGDPRFNGILLEHWLHVVRGVAVWQSPTFYFPVHGVLGFSDGLILYAPFYIGFRLFGADPYLALTQTILVLPVMGYVALFIFFRRVMGIDPVGAGILSMGGILSSNHTRLALFAWPQNFTVFFIPISVLLIGLALRRPLMNELGAPRILSGFVGGLIGGLLMLTSFYTFWFAATTLAIFLIVFTILCVVGLGIVHSPELRADLAPAARRLLAHWPALVAMAAGTAVALIPAMFIYLPVAATHNFDPSQAYERLLAWQAPPLHNLQGLLNYLATGLMPMAYGGTTVLALVAFSGLAFISARPALRLFALAGLIAGLLICLSMYRFGNVSLWSIFRMLPGGSAIRDPSRFEQVIHLASVLALGGVTAWIIGRGGAASRYGRAGLYILLLIVTLDGWRRIGPAHQALPHQEYFAVIAAPYRSSGQCRSFFLGSEGAEAQLGRHPHPWQLFNLDAVYLSYRFGLPTLNGFSAFSPKGWNLAYPHDRCYLHHVDTWIEINNLTGVCVFDYATRQLRPYTRRGQEFPAPTPDCS